MLQLTASVSPLPFLQWPVPSSATLVDVKLAPDTPPAKRAVGVLLLVTSVG